VENVKNWVVDISKVSSFRTRWRALVEKRALIDYECAVFARDVRSELPDGASGDHQFLRVLREGVKASGHHIRMLHVAAKAIADGIADKDTWVDLGGWRSIRFLMGLKKSDRNRVLTAALDKVKERGRAISSASVRAIAYEMKIETQVPGRPNRIESERKLATIRSWLIRNKDKLPKMPADVAAALGSTTLSRLVEMSVRH